MFRHPGRDDDLIALLLLVVFGMGIILVCIVDGGYTPQKCSTTMEKQSND